MAQAAQQSAAQAMAQNNAIRQVVLQNSQDMMQPIYSNTIVPANTPTLQIPLRQVGLVKGFIVEVVANVSNAGAGNATLSQWGPANIVSNFTFTDLDNYQRINTNGLHMNALNTSKGFFPFGVPVIQAGMSSPVNYGNNYAVQSATATVNSGGGTGTVRMCYYVPLAYSNVDLRGSVWMGVVNATAYLSLTIPSVISSTTDPTLFVYGGANTNVTNTSTTVTVYQCYLDQLPLMQNRAPMLPPLDIATQYRLVTTTLTGVTPAQDFPIPFPNFQDFLSLNIVYDQAGTLAAGTDINYFSLAAANTLQLFKRTPTTQALMQRARIKTDFPLGSYNFDFREQPVSTNQQGNMQLLLNPITAAAGAQVIAGFESFAMVNTVLGAASLPAG